MTKKEFLEKTTKDVSDEDFGYITDVCKYHPAIRNLRDPEAGIVYIYNVYGMSVIYDMLPRAYAMRDVEKMLADTKLKYNKLLDAKEDIATKLAYIE